MAEKTKQNEKSSTKVIRSGSNTNVTKDQKSTSPRAKSRPNAMQRGLGQKSHSASSGGSAKLQLDYLRLEHDRAMQEERRQNCCLCVIIVISLCIAAALVPTAFADRLFHFTGWNWTESVENMTNIDDDFFTDVMTTKSPVTEDHITREESTVSTVSTTTGKKMKFTRPIINLTELCMKIEPQGCFFHKNIYPDNCRKTTCHSIIIDLALTREKGFSFNLSLWNWDYSKETRSIDIPDWTPCATGKLCIGGRCVDHMDSLQHVIPRRQSGGIRVICDERKSCVTFKGELLVGEKALKFTTCTKRSCNEKAWPNNIFTNEMAVRFLSCSNPYPVENAPGCFVDGLTNKASRAPTPQYDFLPFVLYDFCLDCAKTYHNVSCSKLDYWQPEFTFGVPCHYADVTSGKRAFCAGFGTCVPLYKDDPRTYSSIPVQKC